MSVLDLTNDIKPYLSIVGDTDNLRLQAALDAAESMIADIVGPLAVEAATERVPGCRTSLLLSKFPVVSLTSVTSESGAALDVSLLYTDTDAGIVTYKQSWCNTFWSPTYTVVYDIGFATVPADLVRGIAALTQHLWTPQRGTAGRGQVAPEMTSAAPYALPNFVSTMIARYVPLASA